MKDNKDKLEQAFREKLQDYEAPYNPKAWSIVRSKIGTGATATGNSITSSLKWVVLGVLISGMAIGSYYLWNKNSTNTSITQHKMVKEEGVSSLTTSSLHKEILEEDKEKQKEKETKETSRVQQKEEIIQNKGNHQYAPTPLSAKNSDSDESNKNRVDSPFSSSNSSDDANDREDRSNNNSVYDVQYIAGFVSENSICLGQKVVIRNPEVKSGKVRFKTQEGWQNLAPSQTFVFSPSSSTVIQFVDEEGEIIAKKYIKVHPNPTISFTYNANIFKEGLPIIICKAYGDKNSYEWSFDGNLVKGGSVITHHLYKKGEHSVSLKTTNSYGCENTVSKTVYIDNDYNLMAVDAFRPHGDDVRNITFMPFSLTQREVRFHLTIIDPVDNGIVFTSSTASNAWDGVDQRTGEMTPGNKIYIWKVQIYTPEKNERPIYKGTIIHD